MPSFEEKGMAKAAARRAAREAKRLGKDASKVAGGVGKLAGKGLFKLIIMNPYIGLALLCILAAFIIYTVYSVNSTLDKLLYQYTHLVDTSQQNSKAQFDKKLHYIKVNSDGTTTVVIGLKSEIDAQQLQQAVEDAGGGDTGITDPSSEGVFETLTESSGVYNYSGVALSVMANNGQEFPLYSGIPGEWKWSKDTSATVWHYQNTADAWVKNFSSETGADSCVTYSTLNKEFNKSDLSTADGVKCLQICTNAAIVNCGFTASGANVDVYSSATGKRGVIVLLDSTTNNYYYMPVYVTDAKAHTYPGGVVQTQCSRYSKVNALYSSSKDSCSDYGKAEGALHGSSGHYDYSDRKQTVEIEANWTQQPIQSNWKIIDVIIER